MTTVVLADNASTGLDPNGFDYKQIEAGTYLVASSLEGVDGSSEINLYANIGPVQGVALAIGLNGNSAQYITLPRCTIASTFAGRSIPGTTYSAVLARVGDSYNTAAVAADTPVVDQPQIDQRDAS